MNLASFQNLCHWHLFQPCTVQMKQISMLENQGKMLLEVPENNNEKKKFSDFVTNRYVEPWDSSCEKS